MAKSVVDPKTYAKNVIKSAGYIGTSTIKGINPELTGFLTTTSSDIKDMYNYTRHFKTNVKNKLNDVLGESGFNDLKKVGRSALDDLKTGKFYNPGRAESNMNDMMKSFGFNFDDLDFDIDENYGDSDSSSSEGGSAVSEKSMSSLADKITSTQKGTSEFSTSRITRGAKANTAAMMAFNQKMFGEVNTSLAAINSSIMNLHQDLAGPLNAHITNSSKFYEVATTELSKQTSLLENINNILTERFAPKKKGFDSKLSAFEQVFGNGKFPSFKNWAKVAKDKILSESMIGSMAGFIDPSMLGMLLKTDEASSPIAALLSAFFSSRIRKGSIGKALDRTTDIFKGGFTQIAARISSYARKNRNKNTLPAILARLFDIAPNDKSKMNFGDYNKGRADWTGQDSRALQVVIPTQLAQILSALTGEEAKIYDYKSGKFVTSKQAMLNFKKGRTAAIGSASAGLRNDIIKGFIEEDKNNPEMADKPEYTYSSRAVRNLSKDYDTLMSLLTLNGVDTAQFKKRGDIVKFCQRMGWLGSNRAPGSRPYFIDKKSIEIIDRMLFKNVGTISKVGTAVYSGKIADNRYFQNASAEGTLASFAGSGIANTGKNNLASQILNTLDDHGNNLFFYLQDFYTQLRKIASGASFGSSGSSELKSSGKTRSKNNFAVPDNSKRREAKPQKRKYAGSSKDLSADDPEGREVWNPYTNSYEENDIKRTTSRATREKEEKSSWISRLIDKFNGFFENVFFGDATAALKAKYKENGGLLGLVKSIPTLVVDGTKELFGKIKEFFSSKWSKFKESGFGKEYFKNLKESAKKIGKDALGYGKEKVGKAYTAVTGKTAPWEAEVSESGGPTAANGGYVRKSGMASVSEGEMIIPAKYNPFYHGKMSKSIRNSVEKKNYNAWKRATGSGSNFIGFYADGTIDASNIKSKIKEKLAPSDEDTLSKEDKKFAKELAAEGFGIEQIAKAMKKSAGAVGKFLKASKAQTERWAKKKAESSEGFQKVKEVAKSSVDAVDNAIDHLFGNSEKYADVKGNIKEAYRAAKVNMPKTLAKGTIGALIAGAATGSGLGLLGGFAIGAGQEILKNSETLSRKLFGEEVIDDNGQRHWVKGKLPPSVSKFIKEKLPSAAKGGALGGILGTLGIAPGGILGGMVLGSGLQLLSTTDKFKEIMFGPEDLDGKRRGGLLGSLKVNVVDRLIKFTKGGLDKIGKYITKNFLNPLKTLGTAVADWTKGKVKSIGKTIADKVKEKVKSTVGQKLNKIIKPVTGAIGWAAKKGLKLAGGIASAPFRFVGNTLGGALEQHNIRRGFSSKTIEERMALEEQGTSTKGLLGLIGKGIRHIPGMKDSKFGTIRNNAYTKWAYGKSEDEIRAANEYLNGSNVNKRKARDTRQGLYNTITSSLNNGGLDDPKKLKEIKKMFNTDAVLKDNDFSEVEKYINESSDFGEKTKESLKKEITKRKEEISGYQNAKKDFDQKREEFLNSLVGPDGKPLSKRERKKFIKTGRSQSDIDVAGFDKKRDAARLEEILEAKKKDDAAAKLKEQEQESPIDAKRNTLLTGILDVIKGIASHLGIEVKDNKEENGEASTPEEKKATDIVEDVLPTAESAEESSTEPGKKSSKREARKQARADRKKKRQEKRAAKKEEKKASDIVEETLPSSEEPIEEEEVDEADTPKRPGIFRRIGHRIGNVGRGIKSKWNSLKNRVSSRVGKIKSAFHTAKIAAETAVESLPVVGAIKDFKNRMVLKEEEKKNPLDGERNKLLGGLLNVTSALATINGIKVHKKGKYSAKATAKIKKRLKIGLHKSTDELSEIESDVKDVRSSAPGTTSAKSNVPSPSSNGKIDFITQSGQPIEYTRDSKGELQQNTSDASTKKYFDDLEEEKAEKHKFFSAFTGKGGLLGSIKGLFGKKDGETGEKKESLLSRIFGKVKNLFSGEDSIFSKISNGIGGIFSAIGGSGGLLSVLITGLKTALPTILSSVGLGILLNKIGENAAGTSKDSGMYKGADAEARKEEVKNSGVITKIGLGADAIENTIRGRDTTTYNEDDHVTEYMSSRFKKRVIKNALTSFNPKLAKATSKVVNKTIGKIPLIGKGLALPLDAVGKGKKVAKFAKKIGDTKIFKAVAGSKAVQAAGKATGTVVTKIKDLFEKVLGWIAEKLGKKGGEEVIKQGAQEAAEEMVKKGGSKLAGALAKFSLTLQIITITNAFTVGLQNAGAKRILGILDTPTFVQRLLAAALNALNEAIPGIGGLIPTEVLFSIVYSLLKALGCDFGKLDEQRAQAKATVEAYNQEHGTTYNIEEYLANVLNEMTIQDRIKGGIKKGVKAVGNWVKGIFGGGSKDEEDNKTSSNQPKVLNPSAVQENINKMNRSTQAAKASVNSIKPTTTAGTRRVVNNKPFATPTKTPTAIQRNPGAPLAATGSGIFNFTGSGAEDEALSTSESAALTRISEDTNTQTTAIQSTDNYISDLWKFSDPDTKIEEFDNTVKRYTTNIPEDSYSGKLMSTITGIMKMAVGIVRPIRNIVGTIGGDISAISDSIFNNAKSSSGGKGTFSYITSRAKKYWDWSGDEPTQNTGSGSNAPSTSVHTTQKGNFNKFGKTTIDQNGCGPAVAATVLKAYGKNADINSIANYAENNGYVAGSSGVGTRASYFSDILGKNGIGTSYENNASKIKKAVSSGRPTILLGQDKSNKTKTKSPFGPNPHYVVARGTDRNGNVYVDDPELGTTALYKNNILNKAKLGVVTGRGTGIKRYPYILGGDSNIENTSIPASQNSGETFTPAMSKLSMMPENDLVMNAATAKAAKAGIIPNTVSQDSTTGDSTEEESNKITDIGSLISAVLGKAFGKVTNDLDGTFAGKILRLIFGNFEQSENSTAATKTSAAETSVSNPVNTVTVPDYDKAHEYDTSVGSITNHYGNDITGLKVATRLPTNSHPYIKFYNNNKNKGINARPDGGSRSNPVKPPDAVCNVVPSDIGWVSARFNHIYCYLTGCTWMKYPFLCTAKYNEIKPLAKKNGLTISQYPQVGAIMLWTNDRNSKGNHVAIVEKVISDSKVVTSESSSTEKFYSKTREKLNGGWGSNIGTFEGFIYNPGVVQVAVTNNLAGNSYLVRDSKHSPLKSTRNHSIDTIIIGSISSIKSLDDVLYGTVRAMHPNYIIYPNGIGSLVDENYAAWFPFNEYNDICGRSVSIAISPYDITDTSVMESMSEKQAITSEMYNNLARLIADISIRNGIKEIVWNPSAKDYNHDNQNIYMEKMINKNIIYDLTTINDTIIADNLAKVVKEANAMIKARRISAKNESITTGKNDKEKIWNFLKDNGFTDIAAAAVMGNFQQESGNRANSIEGDYLNAFKKYGGAEKVMASPKAMHDYMENVLFPIYEKEGIQINKNAYKGRAGSKYANYYLPGFGLPGWTGPKASDLLDYADKNGEDWRKVETQLHFIQNDPNELMHKYQSTIDAMNNSSNVAEASKIFFHRYENPAMSLTSDLGKKQLEKRSNNAEIILGEFAKQAASGSGLLDFVRNQGGSSGNSITGYTGITKKDYSRGDDNLLDYINNYVNSQGIDTSNLDTGSMDESYASGTGMRKSSNRQIHNNQKVLPAFKHNQFGGSSGVKNSMYQQTTFIGGASSIEYSKQLENLILYTKQIAANTANNASMPVLVDVMTQAIELLSAIANKANVPASNSVASQDFTDGINTKINLMKAKLETIAQTL